MKYDNIDIVLKDDSIQKDSIHVLSEYQIKNLTELIVLTENDLRNALKSKFLIIAIENVIINKSIKFNYIICDSFIYIETNFKSPRNVCGDMAKDEVAMRFKRINDRKNKYKTKLQNYQVESGLEIFKQMIQATKNQKIVSIRKR